MRENDEINIFDLWLIIVKHKKLFWLIFIIILVLGLAFAIMKPKKYEYTQAIQIATHLNDSGETVPFIASQAVMAKIQNIYLPIIFNQYAKSNLSQANELSAKSISVNDLNSPNMDSGLIAISAKGAVGTYKTYQTLFADILKQLQTDTYEKEQKEKAALGAYLKILQQQLKTQQVSQKTLQKSLGTNKGNLIQTTQQAVLVASQGEITNQLLGMISNIKNQMTYLQNSRFSSDFIRSTKPVGISTIAYIALAIFAGLIFAFVMVFIVEFFAQIKRMK